MIRSFVKMALLSALTALLSFGASTAEAQQAGRLTAGGMDLHLFRPAIDSKGLLSVNGTDILGANEYSFGLVMDAGFGLLRFDGFENDSTVSAPDAARTSRLVDYFFTGTLHFNYGIANLLVVGVQLPIQVVGGPNVSIPGAYNDPMARQPQGLEFQGVGNIVLHSKFRLLRAERNPIGLAAMLNIELPTGTSEAFAGDPGVTFWPQLAAEWLPHRRLRVAANVGARVHIGDDATIPYRGRTCPGGANATGAVFASMGNCTADGGTNLSYGQLLTFGAGIGWRAASAIELVAEVYGNQIMSEFGTTGALATEAMGGIKIFVERNSYLVLGGGAGFAGGFSAADGRAMLGFIFEPTVGDRDGDGLRDDVDQCPDEPEDFDNFADQDGCPEPDNDRDGILDVDDECPMVPEDRDGDADEDGCPEGNEGDRDGDGILDTVDQCPDDPEDRDSFQDEDGCPDPDNDQDQILDADDLCPNDAEDRDGFEDENGCPDPDNDGDRILDPADSCPNDPETYNGFQDDDGCPDRGSVLIEENQIVILEKIYFATDSAVILERSFPIIEAVAATLVGNPQIQYLEIQGHADERSSDEYNIRLTRDRAASVLEALSQRGVARDRMRSAGYGERCPVNPQHNETAWEQNRRVEFKILRTEDGPTNVEVACPAGRELVPN